MGVRGLTTLVRARVSSQPQTLPELAAKFQLDCAHLVLLVDGPSLVYWLIEQATQPTAACPFPSLFGGDHAALHEATCAFVRLFSEAGVGLHFVFDGYGGIDEQSHKSGTLQQRFEGALQDALAVQDYCSFGSLSDAVMRRLKRAAASPSAPGAAAQDGALFDAEVAGAVRGGLKIHTALANAQVRATLQGLAGGGGAGGVRVTQAFGEADYTLAVLAASQAGSVLGVLSSDSDFLVFRGCRMVELGSLPPLLLGTAPGAPDAAPLSLSVISPADVALALSLPPRLLVSAAILAGNDYSGPALAAAGAAAALGIGALGAAEVPTPQAGAVAGWEDEAAITAVGASPPAARGKPRRDPGGSARGSAKRGRDADSYMSGDIGPASAADWLDEHCCTCDEEAAGAEAGRCGSCHRPLRMEDVPAFAAFVAAHPTAGAACAYARTVYELRCDTAEATVLTAAARLWGAGGEGPPLPPAVAALLGPVEPAHEEPAAGGWATLGRRLGASPHATALYAAALTALLPVPHLETVETRQHCCSVALERVNFSPGRPSLAAITRPFRAVGYGWALPGAGGRVRELVPAGAVVGEARVLALHPGRRLGIEPLATAEGVPPICSIRLLALAQRQALFQAAASAALVQWSEEWAAAPGRLGQVLLGDAPSSSDDDNEDGLAASLAQLSLGGGQGFAAGDAAAAGRPSPWLASGAEAGLLQPPPHGQVTPASLTVLAIRHLIAVTSHYEAQAPGESAGAGSVATAEDPLSPSSGSPSKRRVTRQRAEPPCAADMPSRSELGALLAMVLLLQGGREGAGDAASPPLPPLPVGAGAFPALRRPHIRSVSVASWFTGCVRSLLSLAAGCGLVADHGGLCPGLLGAGGGTAWHHGRPAAALLRHAPSLPGPPPHTGAGEDAEVDAAGTFLCSLAAAALLGGGGAGAGGPAPPCPEPRSFYDGRLLHAMLQELSEWGQLPQQSAQRGLGGGAHQLLPPLALHLLSQRGLLPAFAAAWEEVLAPFEAPELEAGYARIAAAAAAHVAAAAAASSSPAVATLRSPGTQLLKASGPPGTPAQPAPPAPAPPAAAPSSRLLPASVVAASASASRAAGSAASVAADAIKVRLFATAPTFVAPPAPVAPAPLEGDREGHTAALPITKFRDDIVHSIARHTVCVIKGDTGSGKSTRVPQYILESGLTAAARAAAGSSAFGADEAAALVGRGGGEAAPSCPPPELWGDAQPRIYVTQPRRVAAVTLARRVSEERGEAEVGGLVGFRIGHERCASARTRITFVTTGWLLQFLVATTNADGARGVGGGGGREEEGELDAVEGELGNVTHVVLDEVHERGIDTDLVCLVLKLAMVRGMRARARALHRLSEAAAAGPRGSATDPAAAQLLLCRSAWLIYARRLRLVLMSATFDTTIFSSYLAAISAGFAEQLEGALARAGGGRREEEALLFGPLFAVPRGPLARVGESMQAPPPPLPPPQRGAPRRAGAAPGAPDTITLLEAARADHPATLQVGAKRYPVEVVWLEEVYDALGADIGRGESTAVFAAVQKYDLAARNWAGGGPGGGRGGRGGRGGGPGDRGRGPPQPQSVGDALTLPDAALTGLFKLAVRVCMAVARQAGDCVLIFVSGMAEIDALVELFLELCPGRVAAPTARVLAPGAVGTGEDEGIDAAAAEEYRQRVLVEQQRRLDGEGSGGSEEEAEAGGAGGEGQDPAIGGYDPAVDRSTIRLLPMHSLISFEDQMAAFSKADGSDMRTRVVIATNIAESSVTLPDVHTVIDFGRAKTVEYVPKLRASCLRSTWISQASAAQRSGRAGRLMPGTVFRMYTEAFHDTVMPRYDVPEMLRLTLENVVLKVKLLGIRTAAGGVEGEGEEGGEGRAGALGLLRRAAAPGPARLAPGIVITGAAAHAAVASMGVVYNEEGGEEGAPHRLPPALRGVNSAKAVLAQSIQSPDPGSVDAALGKLAALGALTSAEDSSEVTPFGRSLASFPGDLGLGKLCAFANMLGCLGDGVVMAAALAVQDIFMMPHPSLADSVAEYAALVAKVLRGRWLFSLDPCVGGAAGAACSEAEAWAERCCWSEPIAARNAYIAWRGVPAAGRNSWCAAYGIVGRRMTAMHSMVREIGHRVVADAHAAAAAAGGPGGGHGRRHGAEPPAAAASSYAERVVAALIGGERDRGDRGRGGEEETRPGGPGPRWPPPRLFSTDTHLLRLVLVAALNTTVAQGAGAERGALLKRFGKLAMDPCRSASLNLSSAPPDWLATLDLTLRGGGPGGAGGALFPRPVGALARGLASTGVAVDRSGPTGVRLVGDRAGKAAALEFPPDWDVKGLALGGGGGGGPPPGSGPEGQGAPGGRDGLGRHRGGSGSDNKPTDAATAAGMMWRALPRGSAPYLGLGGSGGSNGGGGRARGGGRGGRGQPPPRYAGGEDEEGWDEGADDDEGGAPAPWPSVRSTTIALAMPVSAMALAAMSGPGGGGELKLPQVPLPAADREALAAVGRDSGARAFVPGAAYATPAGDRSHLRASGLAGTGGGGGGGALGRAALPASALGYGYGGQQDESLPVAVGAPTFASTVAWHLLDATTGYRAFTVGAEDEGEDSGGGDGGEDEYAAMLQRLHGDNGPRQGGRGGGGSRGGRGSGGRGGRGGGGRGPAPGGGGFGVGGPGALPLGSLSAYSARPSMQSLTRLATDRLSEDPGPLPAGLRHLGAAPLLAVSSGLQLQETRSPDGGSRLVAVMNGMTLLWRCHTTLALAFLVFARGVEVEVAWADGPGGRPCVASVVFDPAGPAPLELGPLCISSAELREVAILRACVSAHMADASLMFDATQQQQQRARGGAGAAEGGEGEAHPRDTLRTRVMRLLYLEETPAGGQEPRQPPQLPRGRDTQGRSRAHRVLLRDFDAGAAGAPPLHRGADGFPLDFSVLCLGLPEAVAASPDAVASAVGRLCDTDQLLRLLTRRAHSAAAAAARAHHPGARAAPHFDIPDLLAAFISDAGEADFGWGQVTGSAPVPVGRFVPPLPPPAFAAAPTAPRRGGQAPQQQQQQQRPPPPAPGSGATAGGRKSGGGPSQSAPKPPPARVPTAQAGKGGAPGRQARAGRGGAAGGAAPAIEHPPAAPVVGRVGVIVVRAAPALLPPPERTVKAAKAVPATAKAPAKSTATALARSAALPLLPPEPPARTDVSGFSAATAKAALSSAKQVKEKRTEELRTVRKASANATTAHLRAVARCQKAGKKLSALALRWNGAPESARGGAAPASSDEEEDGSGDDEVGGDEEGEGEGEEGGSDAEGGMDAEALAAIRSAKKGAPFARPGSGAGKVRPAALPAAKTFQLAGKLVKAGLLKYQDACNTRLEKELAAQLAVLQVELCETALGLADAKFAVAEAVSRAAKAREKHGADSSEAAVAESAAREAQARNPVPRPEGPSPSSRRMEQLIARLNAAKEAAGQHKKSSKTVTKQVKEAMAGRESQLMPFGHALTSLVTDALNMAAHRSD